MEYPLSITGDWHIHGRGEKRRLDELDELTGYFFIKDRGGDLVICGDLLDRNAPMNVQTILKLAQIFQSFEHVYIVVGNHDVPTRSTLTTQLDLFTLCPNVEVIKKAENRGIYGFIPYYEAKHYDIAPSTEIIFAHMDVKELNGYADQDFAISLQMFKNSNVKYIFNGHLHNCGTHQLPNGGYYIQLGAPWPCTWADKADTNNFVWTMDEASSAPVFDEVNITGDRGMKRKFIRTREELAESEYSTAEVQNALDDIRDQALSIPDAMKAIGLKKKTANIVTAIVDKVNSQIAKESI